MLKIFEKHGMLRCIACIMDIIAMILIVAAVVITHFFDFSAVETVDMILKISGMVLFVVGSMIIAMTSKEHRLVKSIFAIIISSIILTWVFPYGYFQGTDFYDYGMKRIGFVDVGYALYYAVNFIMDKIVILFVITGFYGVLSKISGYQKLVQGLADKLKNHAIITSVIISILLFVLTSLFTQTFIVLIFIPLLISVLLKMNLDKLTVFAVTFGSALVGILGCTYGTDSLLAFNNYLQQDVTLALNYRFIIAAVAIVLYNFFIVMRVRKVLKETEDNTKNNEIKDDPFEVAKLKEKDKEKVSTIPTIIVLLLIGIITFLGYVAWNTNFSIEAFQKFHDWLISLEAGKDFTIISYIIGSNANAFGEFKYVFDISIVLLLGSALLAFLYKMKLNDFFDAFLDGTKKMFKPMLLIIGVYVVFGMCYLSPVLPTVANWILNLVEGFNPYLTSVVAFVSSLFQADAGYTAYVIGGFLTSAYSADLEIVHAIFTSMYGLVQIFMPTSALLVVGLSMMKVDYKDWFKYIWLFAVGMLVILLVLFTVITYI